MAFKDFWQGNKGAILGSLAGPLGGIIGRQFDKKREAEGEIAGMTDDIRSRIGETPLYEVPDETRQMMEMYGETAGDIRGMSQDALGLAESRTGAQEAPGMGIAREQARAAGAGSRQSIIEAGGGSASSLGAIAASGRNELNSLRDLAVQNQQYRSDAESQYLNQMGASAGMMGQAAQIEGAGLGAMAQEKARVYESELGRYQDMTQFDITQLGNTWAEEQARKARNAQYVNSTIGAVGSVAKAVGTGG